MNVMVRIICITTVPQLGHNKQRFVASKARCSDHFIYTNLGLSPVLSPASVMAVTEYLLRLKDLVPPMPVGTLGSSLTPERTIHHSVFSLFPCNVGSRQVFLECSAPCLLWSSSSSNIM